MTDWRQTSAMQTNQSNGRGWDFGDKEVQAGIRAVPGLIFFAAIVAICAVVWVVS